MKLCAFMILFGLTAFADTAPKAETKVEKVQSKKMKRKVVKQAAPNELMATMSALEALLNRSEKKRESAPESEAGRFYQD